MDNPLVGGLLAFLAGTALSGLNYGITGWVLKAHPNLLPWTTILRQLISVGGLVGAYLLGGILPWGRTPLLLGAAAGLTIPSILLSLRLSKRSAAMNQDDTSSKGANPHE